MPDSVDELMQELSDGLNDDRKKYVVMSKRECSLLLAEIMHLRGVIKDLKSDQTAHQ